MFALRRPYHSPIAHSAAQENTAACSARLEAVRNVSNIDRSSDQRSPTDDSITSSARVSSDGGIVKPNAFAVL